MLPLVPSSTTSFQVCGGAVARGLGGRGGRSGALAGAHPRYEQFMCVGVGVFLFVFCIWARLACFPHERDIVTIKCQILFSGPLQRSEHTTCLLLFTSNCIRQTHYTTLYFTAPMLGHIDRENTMKRLDSSSALITVDGAESAVSWRLRLMQLRALNSGAGNASGM